MSAAGSAGVQPVDSGEGLRRYYVSKNEELSLTVSEKQQDLRRLEAQRNEINAKVRMLREELQLLVSSKIQGSGCFEVLTLGSYLVARTRLLRGRGRQSHGQKEGPGQSASRGQVCG